MYTCTHTYEYCFSTYLQYISLNEEVHKSMSLVFSFLQIRAQDIKDKLSSVPQLSKLETFGFSLSSGVDVDNNGYNGWFIVLYILCSYVVTKLQICLTLCIQVGLVSVTNIPYTRDNRHL